MNFKRILVIILFGLLLYSCGKEEQSSNGNVVPVKTAKVYKSGLNKPIITSGKVEASLESNLSFKVPGIIETINYDEGNVVKKGALIASLNLSEINANVTKAEQSLKKSQRDYDRVKNLYKEDVVTLEQFQNSETALEVAKSDLAIASFNREHSVIMAPSNGTILRKFVNENEMIDSGYPVVSFGSRNGNWKIIASVSDQNLLKINVGDSAAATFDAGDITISGKISTISKSANPYNGSYEIEIVLDNTKANIASGMIADVKIFPHSEKQYYFIPIESLVEADTDTGFVYTVKDSLAKKIRIKTKEVIGSEVAVQDGLQGIDQVITEGVNYLTENSKVKIVN